MVYLDTVFYFYYFEIIAILLFMLLILVPCFSRVHTHTQCQYHSFAKRSETDVHTGRRVLLVRLYVMSESSTDDDEHIGPCKVSLVTHLENTEL